MKKAIGRAGNSKAVPPLSEGGTAHRNSNKNSHGVKQAIKMPGTSEVVVTVRERARSMGISQGISKGIALGIAKGIAAELLTGIIQAASTKHALK